MASNAAGYVIPNDRLLLQVATDEKTRSATRYLCRQEQSLFVFLSTSDLVIHGTAGSNHSVMQVR